MNIGWDLDGVSYAFTEDCRIIFAELLGVDPASLEPAKTWNFPIEQWGVAEEDFWPTVFKGVADQKVWWHTPPIDGSVECMTKLRDEGHRIIIATSRGGGEEATVYWLKKFDIPYDSFCITKRKADVDADVFLDDYERNFVELWEAGKRCALMHQPWNEHVPDRGWRVKTFDAFRSLVKEIEERKA